MEEKEATVSKMKTKLRVLILDLVRYALAFLFVLAAIEKIKDLYAFALVIDSYKIFPPIIVNVSTILIPWLELFIGFGLIFRFKLKANLLLYLLLMFTFTTLVSLALIKGLDIECGCYGENSSKIGLTKLFENILIIIGCLTVYLYNFSILNRQN